MARGVNRVFLIGHLGKDPELKSFPNGDAFCNVSLATSESWTDKQSGEKKEKTEWHNLVFLRQIAEIVGQYCKKGSKIYIEGKLRTRSWEKDGVTRYTTEVVCDQMLMLDSKRDQDEPTHTGEQRGSSDAYRSASGGSSQRQAPAQQRPAARPEPQQTGNDFEDDDIPFS